MTRKRYDSHSTEFGLWLREQKEIDSKLGFITTNIDYMWSNYKTGQWMLIEEKRHGSDVRYSQREQYKVIHKACQYDSLYCGIYLLVFENTSPDDGKIYLNREEITKEQLIKFLKFEPYKESVNGTRKNYNPKSAR